MTRSRLLRVVTPALAVLVLAAVLVVGAMTRTVDSFQGSNEFQLWTSGAVVENVGDSISTTITVTPAQTQASAVRGSLAFDPGLVSFDRCESLVEWAACTESTPGTVLFEAVTSTQWDRRTDLVRVYLTAGAVDGQSLLDITIEQGLAASTAELSGNAIDGYLAPLQDGDANCNASVDITDALVIAQFAAGLRTASDSCARTDRITQLHIDAADFNGDGNPDIVDALLIAQCSAGLVNPYCAG